MSKQSHIKNFFKVKSADEIEVEELLLTQFSRASRAKTLETATTISTISTKIISIMDLSNDVNNIESLVNYDSDDFVADVDLNGTNQPSFPDLDSDIGVEFVGIIKNSSSSVGDAVIQALDTLICPSALPVVFTNNEPAYKKVKLHRSNRPKNWRLIAQYYKENRNAAGTIHHFHLQNDKIANVLDNYFWAMVERLRY